MFPLALIFVSPCLNFHSRSHGNSLLRLLSVSFICDSSIFFVEVPSPSSSCAFSRAKCFFCPLQYLSLHKIAFVAFYWDESARPFHPSCAKYYPGQRSAKPLFPSPPFQRHFFKCDSVHTVLSSLVGNIRSILQLNPSSVPLVMFSRATAFNACPP